jgi:phosphoglycerate dehydrogenase-like enzyme
MINPTDVIKEYGVNELAKRKMIIARNIDSNAAQKIKKIIPDWELIYGRDKSIWEDHIQDAEVIGGWLDSMNEYCVNQTSNLRWLQHWSAGVNDLPLNQLEEKKIVLTSANGVHAYPITETIFALMLSLTRKIHTYIQNQAAKKWDHSGIKLEIHGKTIGIIGVGAIGKETAKIAKAFGMNVLGVRRSAAPEEYVDEMFSLDQLQSVLPRCDYVVVTLPLTKETNRLFNYEQFKLMKSSTFFINIGRGEIVVERDLIAALIEEEIAGAGLDVFETEPLGTESPLWEMKNVIITPHSSGATENYTKRIVEDILIPNLKSYLKGDVPSINLVDYQKGY